MYKLHPRVSEVGKIVNICLALSVCNEVPRSIVGTSSLSILYLIRQNIERPCGTVIESFSLKMFETLIISLCGEWLKM